MLAPHHPTACCLELYKLTYTQVWYLPCCSVQLLPLDSLLPSKLHSAAAAPLLLLLLLHI
jgi:hypothetical protein